MSFDGRTTESRLPANSLVGSNAIPLGLALALFCWEGFRFASASTWIVPGIGVFLVIAGLRFLPLRNITLEQARGVYAWFLLISAAVAYVDYEVMMGYGLWFSQRRFSDPGGYFLRAQMDFGVIETDDPGFTLFTQIVWRLLDMVGQPTFLGLLGVVMVLSSVFAVVCLDLARQAKCPPGPLPYLFIFNPLVVALNASLLRDILLGAIGWISVLLGIALLDPAKATPVKGLLYGIGCLICLAEVFYMRTVSAVFFAGVAVAFAGLELRRISIRNAVALLVVLGCAGVLLWQPLLARSERHAARSDEILQFDRASKSVGSLVQGGSAGRIGVVMGASIVYGLPFWRFGSPTLVLETSMCLGSLFAQCFTALPMLIGLGLLLSRPSPRGWGLLALYFGWCAAAGILLQGQTRYVVSHILPLVAAIAQRGWFALLPLSNSIRVTYYAAVITALLGLQVFIEIIRSDW
jgi:hypothetical protein